ncbi:hypothetical protein LSUB1_G004305 [Lachnellula subtilissima]|uniref:Secreted protein n=1 Tax=Lachnellula subtilissima TaxID=602034 RepID=A0A8H8RUH0_9HELO|nr:hypothetical protein LSUB1_G004305 [Lachnellula subtilissima]
MLFIRSALTISALVGLASALTMERVGKIRAAAAISGGDLAWCLSSRLTQRLMATEPPSQSPTPSARKKTQMTAPSSVVRLNRRLRVARTGIRLLALVRAARHRAEARIARRGVCCACLISRHSRRRAVLLDFRVPLEPVE